MAAASCLPKSAFRFFEACLPRPMAKLSAPNERSTKPSVRTLYSSSTTSQVQFTAYITEGPNHRRCAEIFRCTTVQVLAIYLYLQSIILYIINMNSGHLILSSISRLRQMNESMNETRCNQEYQFSFHRTPQSMT